MYAKLKTAATALAAAFALAGVAGAACAGTNTVTTTTLGSSLNPSNVGQSTTLTATTTPPGASGCSGTVTFKNGANNLTCTSGNQTIASSDGNHTFTATCVVSFPSAGPQSLTAIYSGGGVCNTSTTAAPLIQTVNSVTPVPTLAGWAAYLLTALLLGGGLWFMARRNKVSPFTAA